MAESNDAERGDDYAVASRLIEALAAGQAEGTVDGRRGMEILDEAVEQAGSVRGLALSLATEAASHLRLLAKAEGKSLEELLAERRSASTLARLDSELESDDEW